MGVVKLSTAGITNFLKSNSMLVGNEPPRTKNYFGTVAFSSIWRDATSIGVDSSNNSYSIMSGNDGISVVKYDSTGRVTWQKLINAADAYSVGTVDSSGNIYISFFVSNSTINLIKLDTNGSILWQTARYNLISGSATNMFPKNIVVNNYGQVFVLSLAYYTTYTHTIHQWNTSGSYINSKRLETTTYSTDRLTSLVALDGSNIHISRYRRLSDDNNLDALIHRIRLSDYYNDFITARDDDPDFSSPNRVGAIAMYSDGVYYYVFTKTPSRSILRFQQIRMSDKAVMWSNRLTSINVSTHSGSVASDGTYLYFRIYVIGANDLILKIRMSDGVLMWQRTISYTGVASAVASIGISESNFLWGNGTTSNVYGTIAKLPVDGSKQDTYAVDSNSFTYANGTYSSATAASSNWYNGSSLVASNFTNDSTSTPTYTATTSTLTIATTNI